MQIKEFHFIDFAVRRRLGRKITSRSRGGRGWITSSPQFKDSEIIRNKPIGITRPLMPCELEELKQKESNRR